MGLVSVFGNDVDAYYARLLAGDSFFELAVLTPASIEPLEPCRKLAACVCAVY
jgi:hypothetical protein